MQQIKGIQEISEKFKNSDSLSSTFNNVFKEFKITTIAKELRRSKSKGIDSFGIFWIDIYRILNCIFESL